MNQSFGILRPLIGLNPANILTPSKTPLLQALSSLIQPISRSAPEKEKRARGRDRGNIQGLNLVPRVVAIEVDLIGELVLMKRRLDQNHVEFAAEKRVQVEVIAASRRQ